MRGTSSPQTISAKIHRIAELARTGPEMAFTTLGHHLDVEWMQEAYRRTRKDGAEGVDGCGAAEFEQDLEENLQMLVNHAKAGTYYAPPVKRVHIPKGDGKETRPIGIPTLQDKVMQRAVAMLLEPIYEQDFLDCSYGFRPGRSAHQALEQVWQEVMGMGGCWIVEVDIKKCYDTIPRPKLREVVQKRVRDGVILRLIGKWLNAGVMEQGELSYAEEGVPQGGVISPMLSNIYLHEIVDKWFEGEVKPRLKGRAFLVRYADDLVMGFASEEDARRVWEVLPKRFGKYGLTLHPDKTRVLWFGKPKPEEQEPESFDLLGFRHYWGKSCKPPSLGKAAQAGGQRGGDKPGKLGEQSRGGHKPGDQARPAKLVVKRKTAPGRLSRALKRIGAYCRAVMHKPIKEQWEGLKRKVQGHYGYYGITGNAEALGRFRYEVTRIWRYWLGRRGAKGGVTWEKMNRWLEWFPLPQIQVVHSVYRLAAKL
jgi:RNA-directed DNA polymerase